VSLVSDFLLLSLSVLICSDKFVYNISLLSNPLMKVRLSLTNAVMVMQVLSSIFTTIRLLIVQTLAIAYLLSIDASPRKIPSFAAA